MAGRESKRLRGKAPGKGKKVASSRVKRSPASRQRKGSRASADTSDRGGSLARGVPEAARRAPLIGEHTDEILGRLDIPVLTGLTIGHTADQLTLPIGVMATLDADKGQLTIEEAATT